jgi:hypothetical protein
MSRQWGHWRLGRGGWRALHWSSISCASTPHFLAHRFLARAQHHQHRADRKNCQDHLFFLQPLLLPTPRVCFPHAVPSLARSVHFHRYSPAPGRFAFCGTAVPPSAVKLSRVFADIPYGPVGGPIWRVCAEVVALQSKSPSCFLERTLVDASFPRKRIPSSSAATARAFSPAISSLPTKC